VFDSFDIDRDGRIDAAELGQALAHYKYASSPNSLVLSRSRTSISLHVGQPILNMLVNKYGESDGRVTHTCHGLMNVSDNRDYGPAESASRPSSSRTDGSGPFHVCMCCCAAGV